MPQASLFDLLILFSAMFPRGFIDETLRTLALLLPPSDAKLKRWFRKQSFIHRLDNDAVECDRLRAEDRQIENFNFWRDRLIILKDMFDETEPSGISQWWYDRRHGVQWYTFWVAILVLFLTIFFGLIQCIEGALQVYLAFHPRGG